MPRPKKIKPTASKPEVASSSDAANMQPITVAWSLAELPSPQHRAGLAGLVMLVNYSRRHSLPDGAILDVVKIDEVSYVLQLNIVGLGALFDKAYRATAGEAFSKTSRKDKKTKEQKPHLRIETRKETSDKGKEKEVNYYVYPAVDPHGGPLTELVPPGDDGKWMKVWRQWLWETIRSRDRQRLPYKARAEASLKDGDEEHGDEEEDQEGSNDVQTAWSALTTNAKVPQASTYFLGAEKVTAENTPFEDRGRHWFLLHFWLFAVHVFMPRSIDFSGKYKSNGYVTCIPDVSRLQDFVTRHERSLKHQRSPDSDRVWRKSPKQAIIDLADAAALSADLWLSKAVAVDLSQADARATSGFQIVHAVKSGNSVRIRSNRMVVPTREMSDRASVAEDCWSHLIKHQVLTNILADRLWWHGFDRVCATAGKMLTIKDKGFRHDARILFNHFNPEDRSMSDQIPQTPRSLEQLILRMVTSWLTGRLESKYHLSWNTVKGTPQEADYEEKKTKLATQAFLAARSRPGREFSRWFTATLCSVNQRSISSETDFVALAQALDEQPDHVRSLTLLALSARG